MKILTVCEESQPYGQKLFRPSQGQWLRRGGNYMSTSKNNEYGYACPVRGCNQKKNRRFHSIMGLIYHLDAKHPGYLEKKLRVSKNFKKK